MKKYILGFLMLAFALPCISGVDVIVHPSNNSSIDQATIKKIFTGKAKSFSNGNKAIPITQASGNAATDEFNSKVVKKSSSQLKAHWSKLVFTGKGTPPKEAANDAEVVSLVASNPNHIGFVASGTASGDVKVIGSF